MVEKKIRKKYTDYLVKINCIVAAVLSLQDMEDKCCMHALKKKIKSRKRVTFGAIEVVINIFIVFGWM